MYSKTYRNYKHVILNLLTDNYPIKALYREGDSIVIHNRPEANLITRLSNLGCKDLQVTDNKVTITSYYLDANTKVKVELYDALSNGDLSAIFFDEIYEFLPIHGKTVIDIGANIGDSCVYFALKQPSRIIAIEPFPRSYESARKNIDINGFSNNIILQLAGCAAEPGDITIDPLYESNGDSRIVEFERGIKIPLLTLRDILIQYSVSRGEAVLKMDCEGCEYDSILSSSDDTLRFFTHIQLEYHHGYKNLKEKLEKSGFDVSVTRPSWEQSNSIQGKKMGYTGYLYATRTEPDTIN